jgi:fanconi-associated nuclease 1
MRKLNFPTYIVCRTSNLFNSREDLLAYENAIKLQLNVDDLLQNSGVPTKTALEQVLEIFEEVYPRWQVLMEEEKRQTREIQYDRELQIERAYLRRFTTAWVLTRIVHKGVYVLGRFKQHGREHEVLTKLLAQKEFHKARRGGWYIRKALVEEHYMAGPSSTEAEKRKWRQCALETCISGLQDPDTHLSFHYDLQKRINKLEKKQKVAKKDQHDFGHVQLRKPTTRTVVGVRLNELGLGRKTVWRGNGGEECSVEELCLDHYRMDGWQGYHCEGRIVRTLVSWNLATSFVIRPNCYISVCLSLLRYHVSLRPERLRDGVSNLSPRSIHRCLLYQPSIRD